MIKYSEMHSQQTAATWTDITKGQTTEFGAERKLVVSATEELWKWTISPFHTLPQMQHAKQDRILMVLSGEIFVSIEGRKRVDLKTSDFLCLEKGMSYTVGALAGQAEVLVVQPMGYAEKLRLLSPAAKAFDTPKVPVTEIVAPVSNYKGMEDINKLQHKEKMNKWVNQGRPIKKDDGNTVIGRPAGQNSVTEKYTAGNKKAAYVNAEAMAEYEAFVNAPSVTEAVKDIAPVAVASAAEVVETSPAVAPAAKAVSIFSKDLAQ